MIDPIDKVFELIPGQQRVTQAALAALIGVSSATVSEWRKGRRPVPPKRCIQIEQLTAGAVSRRALRPDDWHLLWPELADKDAA